MDYNFYNYDEALTAASAGLRSIGCECKATPVVYLDTLRAECTGCHRVTQLYPRFITSAEAAAVDAIRAHRRAEERQQQLTAYLLSTAANYHAWLAENGRGSTFSTFCDEYDHQPLEEDASRKPIYDAVLTLIRAAQESAANLAG